MFHTLQGDFGSEVVRRRSVFSSVHGEKPAYNVLESEESKRVIFRAGPSSSVCSEASCLNHSLNAHAARYAEVSATCQRHALDATRPGVRPTSSGA